MLCVIQFDAAGDRLVDELMAEGRMPVLAELISRHDRDSVAGPAAHFPAAAFPCLYTGEPVGSHGHFYPFQWVADQQRGRPAAALGYPPTVWERVAAAGGRALVVDPYEGPQRGATGLDVASGVGFCDRVVQPAWSRPRAAGRAARRAAGRAPRVSEVFGRPRVATLRRLRDALVAAPARTAAAGITALERERYDLIWASFAAAHVAGHQFWDLSQVDEAALGADDRRLLASARADICIATDQAIGELLEALPAATDMVLVSALGMDVNTSRADLLPQMLTAILRGGPLSEEGGSGAWRLRALVPSGARQAIAAAMPRRLALELTARLEVAGNDWSQTRAFAMPADNQGYVRLNLRGRERDGIVEPDGAGELLEEVEDGLRTYCDPDGAPAVAGIDRVCGAYPGRAQDRLPDLVVRWTERPATGLDRLISPRFGEAQRHGAGTGRAGNHPADDGWFTATSSLGTVRDLSELSAAIGRLAGLG